MYKDYYDRQMESFAFAERWRRMDPPDPPPVLDEEEYADLCLHRFAINDPACRVCSGIPRGVCLRYAPENLSCD